MFRAYSTPDPEHKGHLSWRKAATIILVSRAWHKERQLSFSGNHSHQRYFCGPPFAHHFNYRHECPWGCGANREPWISVKSKLLWNPNTANSQLSTLRKGSVDNPEQQMIKKSFLVAFGRCHMLFATEQQNFLSSCVLLRLILHYACISHEPADSRGGETQESVRKQIEWQGKPAMREEGCGSRYWWKIKGSGSPLSTSKETRMEEEEKEKEEKEINEKTLDGEARYKRAGSPGASSRFCLGCTLWFRDMNHLLRTPGRLSASLPLLMLYHLPERPFSSGVLSTFHSAFQN